MPTSQKNFRALLDARKKEVVVVTFLNGNILGGEIEEVHSDSFILNFVEDKHERQSLIPFSAVAHVMFGEPGKSAAKRERIAASNIRGTQRGPEETSKTSTFSRNL